MISYLPAAPITETIDKTTNNIVMVMFGILIGFLFFIIFLMKWLHQNTQKEKKVIAHNNHLIVNVLFYSLIILFSVIIWASPVYLDFPIFLITFGVVFTITYIIFNFSKTGKI